MLAHPRVRGWARRHLATQFSRVAEPPAFRVREIQRRARRPSPIPHATAAAAASTDLRSAQAGTAEHWTVRPARQRCRRSVVATADITIAGTAMARRKFGFRMPLLRQDQPSLTQIGRRIRLRAETRLDKAAPRRRGRLARSGLGRCRSCKCTRPGQSGIRDSHCPLCTSAVGKGRRPFHRPRSRIRS
jgi:hypothetical protein